MISGPIEYVNTSVPSIDSSIEGCKANTCRPVINSQTVKIENTINIHLSKIYEINNDGNRIFCNLFGHPFYYLQNNIKDDTIRNSVKALLFLHTLPFKFDNVSTTDTKLTSFFNNKDSKYGKIGGIETAPYGYLLLLGGLVWRKKYMQSHDLIDPIVYKYSENGSYKAPTSYNPLLGKSGGKYIFFCEKNTNDSKHYSVKYTDMIVTENKPSVELKLLKLFNDFVDNTFPKIIDCCELKKIKVNGNPDDNTMVTTNNSTPTNAPENSTVNSLENSEVEYMTFNEIFYLPNVLNPVPNFKKLYFGLKCLSGEYKAVYSTNKDKVELYVTNFTNNYTMGFFLNNRIYLYYSESNPIQEIFRDLYFREVLVTTIPTPNNPKGFNTSLLKAYYTGYSKIVNQFKQAAKEEISEEEKKVENAEANFERDFKCELYLSLKNIWDRWLCGYYNQTETNGKEMFEVRNFFENNFMFIDSFYCNIYNKLRLNCQKLLDVYKGNVTNNTLLGKQTVAHLGGVVGKHQCVMFNFPDNVNFSDNNSDGSSRSDQLEKTMKDMFTPYPANKVGLPEYFNKFTIIYTHSANKLDTVDRNKFTPDSFDIWSYQDGTGVAPEVFNTPCQGGGKNTSEMYSIETRMGYKVPAFGVAYSRQNNSFWSNIKIGMENYSITEQTIRAEAQIAEKGNSDKRNITFYGQDIYHIYQSYSYTVTIEMLGNAQIQPLMYFQLMNIPMFRGTYMIIKVEHAMKQGHMTTTFTGIKMSKVQPPYTKSWFATSTDEEYGEPPDSNMDESDDKKDVMTSKEGDKVDLKDNELSKAIIKRLNSEMLCDDFVIGVYGDLKVKIKGNLRG